MDNDIFKKLLQKHTEGKALSPEEAALLRQGYDQLLEEALNATGENPSEEKGLELRHRIDLAITGRQTKRFHLRDISRIAAVLLVGITLLAGAYWLWPGKVTNDARADILPGVNKASLTLLDGSVIALEEIQDGTVAVQRGVRIEKDTGGNIRYYADRKQETSPVAINTITTPKGGQYRIILPDGSVARLNAASSLVYPVRFAGSERRVKMTGEVYFEISKLPLPGGKGNVPFFVESAGQEVQVLGTHFNINAYGDEAAIRTTLVEGSVKVRSTDGRSAMLKPGQQAVLAKQLRVQQADISRELAWTNGDFVFRGETLEGVLRQVGRWYDVSVEYPPHIGQLRFSGMISRSQPLSAIVKMIQSTKKATVTIKERRLIVTD
ncbi:FecR family protein [Chitinophaga sp. GCM10012297]|uniref:FecR domain-containing protein n=1 Tax=Chitinophaga chungangae TaxID=2821488 RepID=A0ABS3YFR0_9BACT|nr:FecR domain-containing protein [Chitinophaga chungangae]MBO9153526.1 FecR domain-containing protein [Chitinophaga chungangae]